VPAVRSSRADAARTVTGFVDVHGSQALESDSKSPGQRRAMNPAGAFPQPLTHRRRHASTTVDSPCMVTIPGRAPRTWKGHRQSSIAETDIQSNHSRAGVRLTKPVSRHVITRLTL